MSIPDAIVDEVRQRADLIELVSEHTSLKRSGRTFRGPCPLHGGEGPNFSVDPGRNIYKCFVCGEAGDVFSFPMKMLGLSFLDAVRYVAERVGVEIPEPGEAHREVDPHEANHEVNAFAAEWFRLQLWEGDEGVAARRYLERRGISREAAERFGLGWAPESWSALGEAARRHGISNEMLLTMGLVKEPKTGREPYDAFRGRLIFPIAELGGRIVAFGGRVIAEVEEHTPKYLNSPETPVYRKGDVLYGLSWSRGAIRKADTALVVEGYMDYVSLAANGVENVVAPLGTAMTEHQAGLLARFARRVILLYDSDEAGLKATFRSGDELLRAGIEVLVATLPDGEDPDSLVRGGGAKALQTHLRNAVDVFERKIQILERKQYFSSIARVRRAIDSLLPSVRAASDEVIRDVYISRIAEKTGVPRETLEREAAARPARERAGERPEHDRRRAAGGRRSEDLTSWTAPRASGSERILILLFLQDEHFVERAAHRLDDRDFQYPSYRRIYQALLDLHAAGSSTGAQWWEALPEDLLPDVRDVLRQSDPEGLGNREALFEESVKRLLVRPFVKQLGEIERKLDTTPGDVSLLEEQQKVIRTMREMGIDGSRTPASWRHFDTAS